jgi:hypothetical protein
MKISPPDLQELVEAAGGYDKITRDMWAVFDRAMTDYQRERREAKPDDKAELAPLDISVAAGPIEQVWPYQACDQCRAEAHFGYRGSDGALRWFCAKHRAAECWADARR